ncbi:MAG: hypothetical protein HYV09_40155 [Deltaproteobacteria bacterium]|nr:hypothetical protein [Deltaproteobacteria bacterium]
MLRIAVVSLASIGLSCSSAGGGWGLDASPDGEAGVDDSSTTVKDASGTDGSAGRTLYCENDRDSCMCINRPGAAPGAKCAASDFAPAGLCCASVGYPEKSTCGCQQAGCEDLPSTCYCSTFAGSGASGKKSCTPGFTYCCAKRYTDGKIGSCRCSNLVACKPEDGETPVANCSTALLQCSGTSYAVPSCAP